LTWLGGGPVEGGEGVGEGGGELVDVVCEELYADGIQCAVSD